MGLKEKANNGVEIMLLKIQERGALQHEKL